MKESNFSRTDIIGVLASLLASVIVIFVSRIFVQDVTTRLSLILGLLALTIGLLVTNYIKTEEEVSEFHTRIDALFNRFDNLGRTVTTFNSVSEFPEYEERFGALIDDFLGIFNQHEFFQKRAEITLRQMEEEFGNLSRGRFECDAENQTEPEITRELLKITDENIKPVSYEEEDWWIDKNGQMYMKRHEQLLDGEDIRVARIFITPQTKRNMMEDIFEWHEENGIEWDVLDPSNFSDEYLDSVGEFVIYDDELVREGEPTKGQLANKIVVSTAESALKKKQDQFNELQAHTSFN